MTDLKGSYLRQIDGWRQELKQLGHQLDEAKFSHEHEMVHLMVKDLGVRMRKVCDELGVFTDGTESLHALIRRIMNRVSVL